MNSGARDSGFISYFSAQWLWGFGKFPACASVSSHKHLRPVILSSLQGGCAHEMGAKCSCGLGVVGGVCRVSRDQVLMSKHGVRFPHHEGSLGSSENVDKGAEFLTKCFQPNTRHFFRVPRGSLGGHTPECLCAQYRADPGGSKTWGRQLAVRGPTDLMQYGSAALPVSNLACPFSIHER